MGNFGAIWIDILSNKANIVYVVGNKYAAVESSL